MTTKIHIIGHKIRFFLSVLFILSIASPLANSGPQDPLVVQAEEKAKTPEEPREALAELPVHIKKPATLADTRKIKQDLSGRLMGIVGLLVVIGVATLLSTNRKKIPWRLVALGTLIQVFLAAIILKFEFGRMIFDGASNVVVKILSFSNEGARLIFGNLVDRNVPVGTPISGPGYFAPLSLGGGWANVGAHFAFSVLPTIIFFSALTAILYYFGVLQLVVRCIARLMQRTLKTSGAESFSAAANIFLGQTEAPLLVRPFLKDMTNSEIMAIMTGGFATVSGGVLAAFVGMLVGDFPDIAGHLLAASVMSAPASLVFAKIMLPETQTPVTAKASEIHIPKTDANVFDAAARGTGDGLHLTLNVGAMLIAFVALISMLNWIIGGAGSLFGFGHLTLDQIFSWVFSPFAFVLGVPWEDARVVGGLLGTKTAINEFVAYFDLAKLLHNGAFVHPKSVVIATYALCGFANFASIGVQIGGLSALAPSRRHDFAKIGFRAMIAGTLACMQTAAIAGIIL